MLYSWSHFVWLAMVAVYAGLMTFFAVKFKWSLKRVSLITVCISAVCVAIRLMTGIVPLDPGDLKRGYVVDQTELPFHFCSMMVFAYVAIFNLKEGKAKELVKSLAAAVGLLGPIVACLLPTQGTGFNSINTYEFFLYHGTMIFFAVYLIVTKQAKLGIGGYIKNVAFLASLVVIAMWLNSALAVYQVNFFFLTRPPHDGLPLLNLNNGWYAYFYTVVGLGALALTIFHSPWIIKELIAKKKLKKTAATEPKESIDIEAPVLEDVKENKDNIQETEPKKTVKNAQNKNVEAKSTAKKSQATKVADKPSTIRKTAAAKTTSTANKASTNKATTQKRSKK